MRFMCVEGVWTRAVLISKVVAVVLYLVDEIHMC
jgi:hypothetical protein